MDQFTTVAGTRCRPGCFRPNGNQSHCRVCHETFTTVGNFDRHRRATGCVVPALAGLVADARGLWHLPADPDRSFLVLHGDAERPAGRAGSGVTP